MPINDSVHGADDLQSSWSQIRCYVRARAHWPGNFDLTAIGLSWRVVGHHRLAGPALAGDPEYRPVGRRKGDKGVAVRHHCPDALLIGHGSRVGSHHAPRFELRINHRTWFGRQS